MNIYTDSAYAHSVCHLFGAVWKMRGFRKTDGSPYCIVTHDDVQAGEPAPDPLRALENSIGPGTDPEEE